MKHQDLISKMTLEEKAAFLSGKGEWETRDFSRLEIPSIFCSDGPHGIRKQAGAGDDLGSIRLFRQRVFRRRQRLQTVGMNSLGKKSV